MAWSDFTEILKNVIDKVSERAYGAAAVVFFFAAAGIGLSYFNYVQEVRTKYVTPFESERLRVKLDSCEVRERRVAAKEAEENDLKEIILVSLQRRVDSLSFAVIQAARDNATLQNQINKSTNKIKTTIQ